MDEISGADRPQSRVGLLGVPRTFRRAEVVEVDVARPLGPLPEPGADEALLVVVWLCKDPIGMIVLDSPVDPATLADRVLGELRPMLATMAPRHELPASCTTLADLVHDRCPLTDQYAGLAVEGPAFSVVLCTRDRAESLRRCLLSLAALDYRNVEVVVVDNAPSGDETERVCREVALPMDLRYVCEPTPGLSHARNRGIAEAAHPLIAFLDDDERVHPDWLAALAAEFSDPRVGAASGLVLPAELRTDAQAMFEQHGGHSKGRGFGREVFDQRYQRERQPAVLPFPAFGVGANMAFRASALEEVGRFDVALGAGTATRGAEDTAAFTEIMLAGWAMVYSPSAVTWHYHRDDAAELGKQRDGYSRGLGAYYTALVLRDPKRLWALARAIGPALRWISARRKPGPSEAEPAASAAPGGLRLAPAVIGPFVYLRARLLARRR